MSEIGRVFCILELITLMAIIAVGSWQWRHVRTRFAFLTIVPFIPLSIANLGILLVGLRLIPSGYLVFVSYFSLLFFSIVAYLVWHPILWQFSFLRRGIHLIGLGITVIFLLFFTLAYAYATFFHLDSRWFLVQAHIFSLTISLVFIFFIVLGFLLVWQKSRARDYFVVSLAVVSWTSLFVFSLTLAPLWSLSHVTGYLLNGLTLSFYLFVLAQMVRGKGRAYVAVEAYFRQAETLRHTLLMRVEALESERSHLFQWTQQLETWNRLATDLHAAVEHPRKMMQVVAEGIAETMPVDVVHVIALEGGWQKETGPETTAVAFSRSGGKGEYETFRFASEPLLGRCCRRAAPLLIDAEHRREGAADTLSTFLGRPVGSLYLQPLRANGQWVGAIGVTRSDGETVWSEGEKHFLAWMAQQSSIAFANARLLEMIERGKKEWQAVFDSVNNMVVILDPDLRIRRMNRAVVRALDTDFAELLDRPCYEVFCHRKQPPSSCPLWELWSTHGDVQQILSDPLWQQPLLRDDLLLPGIFQETFAPIVDEDGRLTEIVHTFTDVTAEQKLLADLRRSRQFLQDIVNDLGSPLIVIDTKNMIHLSNQAMADLFDVPLPEMTQQNFVSLMRRRFSDLSGIRPALQELAHSPLTSATISLNNQNEDGVTEVWQCFIHQMRDENLYTVTLNDLTQFQQMQKQAHAQAYYLASVVDGSNEAIVSLDAFGKVRSWNRGAERLFHRTAEEAIGKPLAAAFRLFDPEGKTEISAELLREELYSRLAHVYVGAEERLVVRLSSRPQRDQQGHLDGAVLVLHDNTAQFYTTNLLHTLNRVITQVQSGAKTPADVLPLVREQLTISGIPSALVRFDDQGNIDRRVSANPEDFTLGDVERAFRLLHQNKGEVYFSGTYRQAYLNFPFVDRVLVMALLHLSSEDKPALTAFARQIANNWHILSVLQKAERERIRAERTAERLRQLESVSSALNEAADGADMVSALGRGVSILDRVVATVFFLYDQDASRWHTYFSDGEGRVKPLLAALSGRAAEDAVRPLHGEREATALSGPIVSRRVADLLDFVGVDREAVLLMQEEARIRQAVWLPFVAGQHRLGELVVMTSADVITPDDLDILQILVKHGAVAWSNLRGLKQLENRARDLAELYDIVTTLNQGHELDEVAHLGLMHLLSFFGFSAGAIFFGRDRASCRLLAQENVDPACLSSFWQWGQANLAGDDAALWRYVPRSEWKTKWVGCLPANMPGVYFLPLFTKQHAVSGFLFLVAPEAFSLTPSLVALLTSMVQQITLALQRERLRRQARERTERLMELVRSNQNLTKTTSAELLYKLLVVHGKSLLRADRALLCVFDDEKGVSCPVVESLSPAYVHFVEAHYDVFPNHELLVQHDNVIFVDQIDHLAQAAPQVYRAMRREGINRYCVIAITPVEKGKVDGIITFYYDDTNPFTETDAILAQLFGQQAARHLHNARLYTSLRRHVETVESLLDVGIALGQAPEIGQMLQILVEAAVQTVSAERAALFLWDADKEQYEINAAIHIDEELWPTLTFRLGEGLVGLVGREKRVIIMNDPAHHPETGLAEETVQRIQALLPARNIIGVPIVVDGRVLGVLTVDNRLTGAFDDVDQKLLSALAGQAAVALKNHLYFLSARKQTNLLQLVNEIGSDLSLRLDPMGVVQSSLQRLEGELGLPMVFIGIVESDEVILHGYDDLVIRLPLDQTGVVQRAVTRGETVVVPDVREDPDYICLGYVPQTRSEIVVPITEGHQITAVVDIHGSRPGQYSEEDILIFQALARQIGSSLAVARAYQAALQTQESERVLNELSHAMTISLRLDDVFTVLLRQLVAFFKVDCACFIAFDDQTKQWEVTYSHVNESLAPLHYEVGDLQAFMARFPHLAHGEPVALNDTLAGEEGMPASVHANRVRSILLTPVVVHSRLAGVLALSYMDITHAWSENEIAFSRRMVAQLSLVMVNSELYEETERYAQRTERLVVERTATIRRQKEESDAVLRNIADGIMITDEQDKLVLVNLAFTEMTGYDDTEIESWTQLFPTDALPLQPVLGKLHHAIREKQPWRGQATLQRKDGSVYDVDIGVVPVVGQDDMPPRFVWSLHDVTQIMDLDRMRSAVVSNISHELRTPITNFKLYLELLRRGKPERRERYLAVLEQETRRLQQLVEQILTFSRLEDQTRWPDPALIPLHRFVADLLESFRPEAKAKGLRVDNEVPTYLPPLFMANDHLRILLANLLTNAIHYTGEGRVWVSAHEAERDQHPGVVIVVHDTGPGISKEERKHIFERFYRGEAALQSHEPGSGLGLAIVDYIVSHYGGDIDVTSSPTGSAFAVWLPVGQEMK